MRIHSPLKISQNILRAQARTHKPITLRFTDADRPLWGAFVQRSTQMVLLIDGQRKCWTSCPHSEWQKAIWWHTCSALHFAYPAHLPTQSYPITCLDRRWGLQEVDVPRISRQSSREGGKVVSHKHRPPLSPRENPWYSILWQDESTLSR